MFRILGRFSSNYPWLICAAWLLLGAAVAFVAPAAGHGVQDDDIRFLPAPAPAFAATNSSKKPSRRTCSPAGRSSPSNAPTPR